ncbi:MAG TPA: bifunctional [glutamate--ammonia ligase]-adenylyl-L-tyrosine phosphorylase/[glutamate--ammonia-ligase] adenylyltransferase, partial [Pseudomonadales bacterium]
PADCERLMRCLQPFTYRRYIDFSVIESLREMKGMIAREVRRKGMESNVKLGSGGIREIEFIVQSFQLIRGGQEPALRERYILRVLRWLGEHDYLPADAANELMAAYVFLRNTEHAIQGLEDRQTQMLPETPAAQAAVALVMNASDWPAFLVTLDDHRAVVKKHFAQVISSSESSEADNAELGEWQALWQDELNDTAACARLAVFADAEQARQRLLALRNSAAVRVMQSLGRERLDQFMPVLLAVLAESDDPDTTLSRIVPLLEAVVRRTAYLVLLMENRGALAQLIRLCAASPWIASQLARHPALLDELLDPRTLYSLPDRAGIGRALAEHMMRVPTDDLEQQMDQLRYFRLAQGLRIAACEVTGTLPLMKVSDQLTWLAEALLCYALELAWADMEQRHGTPGGTGDDPRPFVVIGYGKLGGIELGHGSDLDLVFLYDAPMNAMTDGDRPLDNASFFTRLGQRLIHVLTAQTTLGKLYEVDMRLRPSGASGLLVSTVEAFELYQQKEAWTWEHQALVRARVVAGSPAVAERFRQVREAVLCRERDVAQLQQDVADMRRKMRAQLLSADERAGHGAFPLKQGRGGIVDIEFMVQYAALAWAHRYPSLVHYTDNVRILDALAAAGQLDAKAVAALKAAWIDYRMALHRLALQEQPGKVEADVFADHRAVVLAQWQAWLGEAANDTTTHD